MEQERNMMRGKAQTSTEYLIIIAVLLIGVTIVVLMISESGTVSSNTEKSIRAGALAFFDIGIDSYQASSAGVTLTLVNNLPYTVQIDEIYVDDVARDFGLPVNITTERRTSVQTADLSVDAQESYRYTIRIAYSDPLTGQSYTLEDAALIIEGVGSYG
jgi:uncharacterized protein (UPF0333 family)